MPTLEWRNRREALRAAAAAPVRVLHEVSELSVGPSDSPNLLIHGDNLDALKALLPFSAGQVKCIYIDPPYNTGSAFEHYDDHLEHSTWLSLMYPRLELLRQFLSEDGSIWISLDDEEAHYCRVICDEVFGRGNFIADVAWEKSDSPRMDAKLFSTRYDHTLVYAKNIGEVQIRRVLVEEVPKHYNKQTPDGRRYYLKPLRAMGKNDGRADRPNLYYSLTAPDGSDVYPIRADGSDGNWRWSRTKVEENPQLIEWVHGRKGWTPYYRIFSDEHSSRPPETLWSFSFAGSNRNAMAEQTSLFGTVNAFDTPKPERLIQRILEIATDEGDLVLDSFLGSGTTAAVAHKMERRWIGVEMGDHARTHCAVRLQKVVSGEQGGISKAVKWDGGGGFHFLELGEVLRDETGAVRTEISWDALAAHLWWSETKTGFWSARSASRKGQIRDDAVAIPSPVLGIHDGVAYALLFNGILKDRRVNGGNVLTRATLELVKRDLARLHSGETPEKLVVFAEWSRLGQATLEAEKIEFRPTVATLEGAPCN